MQNELIGVKNTMISKAKVYGVKVLIGAAVCLVVSSFCGYNQGGVNTRLQIPFIGHSWIKEEGYYFKIPIISRVKTLNKNGTVASTDNEELMAASSIVVPPMTAPFADSFQMKFEWSARYELPMDDEGLEQVYQTLKSQEALLGNTVMPFAQTLFTNSVNQMIGENFAQGGKSTLLTLLDNQMQFGMYQTKVDKVPVVRKAGKGSNDTLGGAQTDLEVTKVIYLEDERGQRLRTPLSIAQYGIKLVPNSFQIVDNVAVGRLISFIDKKQANLELQIDEDEKQKLLSKQAKTSQLTGENNLVVRTNELNIKKQEAIIAMERQVEEAKLQAEKEIVEREKVASLAIIDKNRELQVSKANEGIQKANAVAAKYEASAIKEVGFANAEVKKADYAAIDKTILALEVDKAKALAMYKSNMTVNMPTVVSNGGSNGNSAGSLEMMTTLSVMEKLGKSATSK
jgi:hypothetical protein